MGERKRKLLKRRIIKKVSPKKAPNGDSESGMERRYKLILALDLATRTGYAYSKERHGFFDNKTKKNESSDFKVIRFENNFLDVVKVVKPDVIVFERVSGRNAQSIETQAMFQGVVVKYAYDNNIPHTAYSATEVKKYATGKGNAGKEAVLQAVNKIVGCDIADDNESDALALWLLADEDINRTRHKEI